MSTQALDSNNRKGRIRPRPVSFGNPALGTYFGCVYTLEHEQNGSDIFSMPEGVSQTERLVAMVDVPPEQVPEGILMVSRSHRSFIKQVRIVISSPEHGTTGVEHNRPSSQVARNIAVAAATSTTTTATKSLPTSAMGTPFGSHASLESNSLIDKLAAINIAGENSSAMAAKSPHARSVPHSPARTEIALSAASILATDELELGESATVGDLRISTSTDVNNRTQIDLLQQHDDQEKPNRTYLVLVELSTQKAANLFVENLNTKPYTSLDESIVCSVHHVVALQGEDGVSLMSPFFAPSPASSPTAKNSIGSGVSTTNTTAVTVPASTTEVHNCAVCLERMELERAPLLGMSETDNCSLITARSSNGNSASSSILTTVCNHSFHMECLLQWQDSPCPVCRYDHSGLNEALSKCHICGTTENNYVCLICGVISCGGRGSSTGGSRRGSNSFSIDMPSAASCGPNNNRMSHVETNALNLGLEQEASSSQPHQQQHFSHTSHAQQHYNDTLHAYALDTETQHVWDFVGQGYVHRLLQNAKDDKLVEVNDPHNTSSYERNLTPGLSDAQEGEVVHRKLEGFASQYYTLLKSQLEQQRIFYEGRLEEIRHEYGGHRKKTVSPSVELISALKQERNQLAQRCTTLQRKCSKVSEDVTFLKNMNESLEANKKPMKHQIVEAQRERAETREMIDSCLPALEEKLMTLMLQLEDTPPLDDGTSSNNNNDTPDDERKQAAIK